MYLTIVGLRKGFRKNFASGFSNLQTVDSGKQVAF